ncbi:MAG: invasion associated locus B family protein [Hyphomicrobiaceae bacterium]|nr:invasion associated locus B family protein [Hyphomicrobiaceae bacterium]
MKKLSRAFIAMLVGLGMPAIAQSANFIEKHGDWSVYAHEAGGKKTCFAVAKPRSSKPKNVRRDPIFFYISDWPADKVVNEISIKMGYPLRSTVPVEIKISGKAFKLFSKDEGAYVEKTADEQQVVTAMKAGSTMVVQGRSTRGTLTTDEYSLSGISKALEAITKACQ